MFVMKHTYVRYATLSLSPGIPVFPLDFPDFFPVMLFKFLKNKSEYIRSFYSLFVKKKCLVKTLVPVYALISGFSPRS